MTDFSSIDINFSSIQDKILSFAGLQTVVELFKALGLPDVINKNLRVYGMKGYTDSEQVLALAMMNLAGGDALDHLNYCRGIFDQGPFGIGIPSPSTARAFLSAFINEEEEKKRQQGKAFIPQANEHLQGFSTAHFHVWQQACQLKPLTEITLDQDATFINTSNKDALYNYHGEKAYEALNTYCAEHDIMVATEFRDGNVPPGYGQLKELKRVLENVPAGVKKVKLRSDSAGYQIDLMKYCACGANEKFGVIDFTISCPMEKELKKAARQVSEKEWQTVYKMTEKGELKATKQEWAEVAYVPNSLGSSKKGPEYRFFVTREEMEISSKEQVKLHAEEAQAELPLEETIEKLENGNENMKKLHLTELSGKVYKIFGMVTNVMDKDGGELIRWHRGRCGKSEEVHHILKEELAGGHVASQSFGANAAYWNIAVLSLSLHSLIKQHLLPEELQTARPKTLRFIFYNMAGLLVHHARKLSLQVSGRFGFWLSDAQRRLRELRAKLCPTG
jgi:hypothetical protein